jgi:hypothetical protein
MRQRQKVHHSTKKACLCIALLLAAACGSAAPAPTTSVSLTPEVAVPSPPTQAVQASAVPQLPSPLPSSTQPSMTMSFVSIVQGAAPGGAGDQPIIVLAQNDAQRAALAAKLSEVDRPALEAVDLDNNVVIAGFQALQPSSGYRIDLLALAIQQGILDITVQLSSPPPGEPVRQGFEQPYHLVRVARVDFDLAQVSRYRMHSPAGAVLQEGELQG